MTRVIKNPEDNAGRFNFKDIERKWQKKWEEERVFEAKEDSKKRKYYVLEMYPYPSASFLHIGHVRNYTIGDIYARYKRMKGFNVLYPMGYDSFGLPAEIAAKKEGIHPEKYTNNSIKQIMVYQKALGNSYDWSRVIASHEPEYYKWNQFFFLKMFEKGLAYRKNAPVNWCENCQSVLANEESEGGKCWRCGNEVVQKDLEQWFFKITDYADRLLKDLDKIEWPERIKEMQRNWIGRSEGTLAKFFFRDSKDSLDIFTTRIDTIFSVTFLVMASNHPRVKEFVRNTKYEKEYTSFMKRLELVQNETDKDKDGFFTGKYVINPATGKDIPVYVANFVVADYGTGVVMADAHDQRDYEFAKKFNIPLKTVLRPHKDTRVHYIIRSLVDDWKSKLKGYQWSIVENDGVEIFIPDNKLELFIPLGQSLLKKGPYYFSTRGDKRLIIFKDNVFDIFIGDNNKKANAYGASLSIPPKELAWSQTYEGYGVLYNSGKFDGLTSEEAIPRIQEWLAEKNLGRKVVNYKIRDWLISRQRYWGTPIPIIYCDKCGVVPVPEKDLPVLLPEKVNFGEGNPLSTNKAFVKTKCPKCNGKAQRETDTMGGFVDSSWYFLRYCDNKNKKEAFSKDKIHYWMPVDQYIGGAEHAVMHLMYARFFVKVLKDLGYVNFDEPFMRLFNQGIVYKDGAKMSKSKGNVVFQTDISNKYGIDTARLFLMMTASPEKQMEWNDDGVEGAFRIINKLKRACGTLGDKADAREESKCNKMIKIVSESIEILDYPKAIVTIINFIDSVPEMSKKSYESLLKLLSPFIPHISEELWEAIGNKGFISLAEWPKADESKINEKFEEAERAVNKTVSDILNVLKIIKEKQGREGEKIYLYVIPNEIDNYNADTLSKRVQNEVKVFAVNDKSKYDPEGKAGKAKPGKPGIFIE